MTPISPFTQNRFEYEARPLYYLPPHVFQTLEAPVPTYIVGTRGTGKTTLLKALTWSERLQSPSLQRQLGPEPFCGRYIGVYLKLPESQVRRLDSWLSGADESLAAEVLGLYIDLLWTELLAEGVASLLANRVLAASPGHEHECVSAALTSLADVARRLGALSPSGPPTLMTMARVVRTARHDLEQRARSRIDPNSVIGQYPLDQPGTLGREISPHLARICDYGSADEGSGWHFKVCMDEAEYLSDFQQQVLNTTVRLCRWPLFPVVAFVGLPVNTTLLPGMSLQKADRQLLVIDEDVSDAEFKDLAEGVAPVRVQEVTRDSSLTFRCEMVLGRFTVNHLLQTMLERSVSPEAKRLLQAARVLQGRLGASSVDGEEPKDGDEAALPIYEAYLISQLKLSPPNSEDARWERYRRHSQEIRKRNVTAYLSICRDIGAKSPRYASGRMVLQMSDVCVRDFLWQIEEIFVEFGRDLGSFLSGVVPAHVQDVALKRASEKKKGRVPEFVATAPVQTQRIIDGLGRLTAILQNGGTSHPELLTSERGVFQLPWGSAPVNDRASLLELLRDAAQAGFIRLLSTQGSTWEFRLHTSLAAAYGFSYRGAYPNNKVPLSWRDLDEFREARDETARERIADQIAARLIGDDPQQLHLFTES